MIISALVVGYFFNDVKSYFFNDGVKFIESNCSLNQTPCEVSFLDGAKLRLEIAPKEIYPLQKIKITAKSAGANEIKLVISGVNMDMGVHEFILSKGADGAFSSEIMLPSCSINMNWQMQVIAKTNNKNYGATFKFWSNK